MSDINIVLVSPVIPERNFAHPQCRVVCPQLGAHHVVLPFDAELAFLFRRLANPHGTGCCTSQEDKASLLPRLKAAKSCLSTSQGSNQLMVSHGKDFATRAAYWFRMNNDGTIELR